MPMTIEKAIRTAIEFETRVWDVYRDATKKAFDQTGRRIFGLLADEEQDHVEYLHSKVEELDRTGAVTAKGLHTAIPAKQAIDAGISKLETRMSDEDRGDELQMLTKALDIEVETSEFYERMVSELPPEGRPLFARFVEIENGHVAIVQAEIDYLNKTGYWFDFREFDFEGG